MLGVGWVARTTRVLGTLSWPVLTGVLAGPHRCPDPLFPRTGYTVFLLLVSEWSRLVSTCVLSVRPRCRSLQPAPGQPVLTSLHL